MSCNDRDLALVRAKAADFNSSADCHEMAYGIAKLIRRVLRR